MLKMEKFDRGRHQQNSEEWEMIKAFFEDGAAPGGEGENYGGIKNDPPMHTVDAIKMRVEGDVGVPFHRVILKDVLELMKAGNPRAKKGEYMTFCVDEKEVFYKKHEGSALRKELMCPDRLEEEMQDCTGNCMNGVD